MRRSPDVAATAQSILAAGEAWKPKFKSLSYVERLAGANGKPGQAVKIELRALPDGLISKREIYGEMFSTRSLMLGNIALLKFQMVGMGTSARRSFGIASGHAASLAAGHDGQRRKAKRQRARVRR